ncbi:MAG TPA: hypothetical protein VF158_17605 [Longimicrobiales bacterium]
MELPFHILAVLGVVAVAWRWLRCAVRVLGRGAEAYFAGQVARTRARRGDLTGMEEASEDAATARRARWRASLGLTLWTSLLALPAWLLPRPVPVYAAYAALWVLPWLRRGAGGAAVRNRT